MGIANKHFARCMTLSAAGVLVTGHETGVIHLWDVSSGAELYTLPNKEFAYAVQLSDDARHLAATFRDALMIVDLTAADLGSHVLDKPAPLKPKATR